MSIYSPQFGDIYLYLRNSSGKPIELQFNEHDKDITENILKSNRNLEFIIRIDNPCYSNPPTHLFLYLGSNILRKWDADYAIQLEVKYDFYEQPIWEANKDDIDRIRKEFWCAATAQVTLCNDKKIPILASDEKDIKTSIQLSYDPWSRAVYDTVVSGLESLNQQANITTPFEQMANIARMAREEAGDSKILALYLRIQNLIPVFNRCVEEILKKPAQRLRSEICFYSTNYALSLDYQHQLSLKASTLVSVHQFERINSHFYPTAFSAIDNKITSEIEENYFVLQCVKQVQSYLELVRFEIQEYVDLVRDIANKTHAGIHKRQLNQDVQRHEEKLQEVVEYIQQCNYYRSRFPVRENASPSSLINLASELLYYDQRYSNIWKLAAKIDDLIKFADTSEDAIPFQIAPFHEVYHKWCLLKTVDALEKLDFVKVAKGSVTPLYGNPQFNSLVCEMLHSQNPGLRLKVFFERKYPFINSTHAQWEYGFWRPLQRTLPPQDWKHTPDICLEFHDGISKYPSLFTLDPTLGGYKTWQAKYKYRDTLRVNVIPKPKAIVKAAWAISPGSPNNGYEPYLDESADFSKGAIILNHTSTSQSQLKETLCEIISTTGLAKL
jgi:hypothetical protein